LVVVVVGVVVLVDQCMYLVVLVEGAGVVEKRMNGLTQFILQKLQAILLLLVLLELVGWVGRLIQQVQVQTIMDIKALMELLHR
jgi:hypothetical protein